MPVCDGGDLAVERRDGDACLVPFRLELTPDVGGARVEAEHTALHAIADGMKPGPELRLPLSIRQPLDVAEDFAVIEL